MPVSGHGLMRELRITLPTTSRTHHELLMAMREGTTATYRIALCRSTMPTSAVFSAPHFDAIVAASTVEDSRHGQVPTAMNPQQSQ